MRSSPHPSKLRYAGVSLLFALLSLVALSLAAVALIRAVDTGALVLGNLGFKQDAAVVSDQVANNAINWLTTNASDLTQDKTGGGYYATSNEDIDATGQQIVNNGTPRGLIDWEGDACAAAISNLINGSAKCKAYPFPSYELNGNQVSYVIFRLCDTVGDPNDSGNSCAQPLTAGTTKASKKGSSDYSATDRFINANANVYYRIIVRVVGPRKTTSYIETIVHL